MSTVEEIKIELDNTYFNVIKFGYGRKVLFLIAGMSLLGLEGSGESIEASYSSFSDDFTVYLLDRKKVLPSKYTIEDMADDIINVAKNFNIKSAYVYGVSQGGMIAQTLAIKYPEFVIKLALCSTYAKMTDVFDNLSKQCLNYIEKEDVKLLNHYFFSKCYSPQYIEKYKDIFDSLEIVGTKEDMSRFKVLFEACRGFDIVDKLKDIKCPVLVCTDKNDHILGYEASIEISNFTNSELLIYSSYSHAVYDELPLVKSEVKKFMLK